MLGNLLGGFIIILIGVNLMPVVADSIYAARFNGTGGTLGYNITGAASTILSLVNIFFALGVMLSGVALTVSGLRNAGVL